MKHHTKLIVLGMAILFGYILILGSNLTTDKFTWKILGLFIVPLGLALVIIGFIERYYKKIKTDE